MKSDATLPLIAPSLLQYNKYEIPKDSGGFYSFIFNDIMGFEKSANRGVHVTDVKLALRGHVRDGYEVRSFEL